MRIRLTAIALVLLLLLSACGEAAEPAAVETKKAPLDAVYYLAASDEYGLERFELQLYQNGDRIAFRLNSKYGDIYNEGEIYVVSPEWTDNGFSASHEHFVEELSMAYTQTLLLSGDSLEYTYAVDGEVDPLCSGSYRLADTPQEIEPPAFPSVVHDENSPGLVIDETLAAQARIYLGLEENALLDAQMLGRVRELEILERQLTSLDGIELFTELERLFVFKGSLSDLSPLSFLTSLKSIYIFDCYVSEIPDLSRCTELDTLCIDNSLITDLSPASKLPSLRTLSLSAARITSVAPLRDNTTITSLQLDVNPIIDSECLSDNTSIQAALSYDYDEYLTALELGRQIVAQTVTDGMTDVEKEVALYERIHELLDFRNEQVRGAAFAYSPLTTGRGVCGDYSEVTALLMNLAGLDTICCISETHAWNMIRLDGRWYHLDCLWDEDLSARSEWQYFNVSTQDISDALHHLHDWNRYPIAQGSMNELAYLTDWT